MPRRPNPRAVALENAAFLKHLRRTGNAHEAARLTGAARSRFTKRRVKDPAFAARWDAALAWAQAALSNSTPARGKPAEPHLVRLRTGAVQLRRRPATAITPEAETRFLLSLAATANVRLSARAAGYASASFYARKRRNPAFAREWVKALALGYDQLELALTSSWLADAHDADAWSHNEPPPVPPMTAGQAIQLLYLHQKEARLLAEPAHIRRRRGEPREAHYARLAAMYEAGQQRSREEFDAAEASRRAHGPRHDWADHRPAPHEPPRPTMPDLAQVTGWSRAGPAAERKPGER